MTTGQIVSLAVGVFAAGLTVGLARPAHSWGVAVALGLFYGSIALGVAALVDVVI